MSRLFKGTGFLIPQSYLTGCKRSYTVSGQKFVNRESPKFQVGQALHETRPFILKRGELTPGITSLEYYHRRVKLASLLPPKSCAIIPSNKVQYASGAVFYKFQQENNLFYLTGWNEPDSIMILEKPTEHLDDVVFHMVVPPKDAFAEKWEGFRTGVSGVKDIFNADESVENSQLGSYLIKIIRRNENIYLNKKIENSSVGSSSLFSNFFSFASSEYGFDNINLILKQYATSKNVKELNPIVESLRKIKSSAELRIMRKAGQISGRAYNKAIARRFRNERTLHAFLEYNFISGGCDKSAYIPVVASGANSLCIHYTRNDNVMYDDEMVLVDASGSLGGYCSDISRTWPVNGKFTEAQKDLYQAVLNVQRKSIELCKASNGISLHNIHEKSVEFMSEELRNLGLKNINKSSVCALYPHYIGHNLGLDVHDVPKISRVEAMKAGQVITIEPGVYIPDDPAYPAHFRNIGIRIEDDIAIGENTYTNLTVEAVKEIADLENLMEHGVSTNIEEDVISPL